MRCGSDFDLKTDQLGKLGSVGMEESKRRSGNSEEEKTVMRVSQPSEQQRQSLHWPLAGAAVGLLPLVF